MNWFEQKSCNFATDFNFIRTYEQLTIDKRRFFYDTRTRSRSPTVDKGRRCYRTDGNAYEAWQQIFQKNLKVLPVVLQVYAHKPYVLSRLWYLGLFSASQRNVCPHEENLPCYLFIYFMVYILPMVTILASRFFFLCWWYRIPFFYFFGINAAHIVEWSWYTTNAMVDSCYTVMIVTGMFYLYGFSDMIINKTKMGRKFFA